MAKIQAQSGMPFNIFTLNLNLVYDAYNYVRTGTLFQAQYGSGSMDTFRGFGFSYNAYGEPTGGTVTSFQASRYGATAYTISDFSVSAGALAAAARTDSVGDDRQLFQSILGGNDVFTGSSGQDTVLTFGGHDVVKSGRGNDYVDAGSGNDTITGGSGQDVFVGGSGADRFVFTRASDSPFSGGRWDTIKDFRRGSDRIDLSKIDADQDGTSGNQAFRFIGSREFSAKDGQLRFAEGLLMGDVNGDGYADFAIRVYGSSTLSAADLVL